MGVRGFEERGDGLDVLRRTCDEYRLDDGAGAFGEKSCAIGEVTKFGSVFVDTAFGEDADDVILFEYGDCFPDGGGVFAIAIDHDGFECAPKPAEDSQSVFGGHHPPDDVGSSGLDEDWIDARCVVADEKDGAFGGNAVLVMYFEFVEGKGIEAYESPAQVEGFLFRWACQDEAEETIDSGGHHDPREEEGERQHGGVGVVAELPDGK